jgi:protein tyrosine/serine phosphatase
MKKVLKRNAMLAGVAALSLGVYIGYLHVSGNFHEVIAGELYRSAQPSPGQLSDYISRYDIKTVINLRGPSNRDWYASEVAVTYKLGVQHRDFPMSAGRQLTAEESQELIALLRSAPKPILIHCLAGADRTGLASVVYLQQIANVDEETAEWQLSPLYGHVALPFSKTWAMDETWEALEKVIGLPS